MNIGLDYDDTYTRDPIAWDKFIYIMQASGHCIFLTTWRFPDESNQEIEMLSTKLDGTYFTSRMAKEKYMLSKGIMINVWIDDNPWAVCNSQVGFE